MGKGRSLKEIFFVASWALPFILLFLWKRESCCCDNDWDRGEKKRAISQRKEGDFSQKEHGFPQPHTDEEKVPKKSQEITYQIKVKSRSDHVPRY